MTGCRGCGACCVNQLILVRPEDQVPVLMVDGVLMRKQWGRCIALSGRVGKEVTCTIYEKRPEICRVMALGSWACVEMRRACGLFSEVES